jgi:hypothetical protein
MQNLGVKQLVLPLLGTKEEKDISDYFRLGNTRENLYSETMAILNPCEIDFSNLSIKSEMLRVISSLCRTRKKSVIQLMEKRC